MTLQRTITETPKIANEDLEARLFYRNNSDDPPVAEMWFQLRIAHSEASVADALSRVKVLDHCDPTTESMNACLVKLRDACLAQAGYTEVQP